MLKIILLTYGIVLCIVSEGHSRQQEFNFHHLTIKDGLSQSTIHAIHQDKQGYMWFGTQDGLNKFDGHQFTVYRFDPSDPHSISDNAIRVIYEDSNQTVWIGTQSGGLNRYDFENDHFIRFYTHPEEAASISDNNVWAVLEDHQGMFWAGTSYGLNLMDRNQGQFFHLLHDPENQKSLSDNQVTALYEDRRQILWAGTRNGLHRFDRQTGNFTRFGTSDSAGIGPVLGMVRSIYEDNRGNFWIGTENHGLFLFDRDRERFDQFLPESNNPYSIGGYSIFHVLEDSNNTLWIATGNDGISVYDRDTGLFTNHRAEPDNPYSINNNGILTLYESRENIFWAGTFAGGVNFLEIKERTFTNYKNEPQNQNSLSNNVVQAIMQDRDGLIWIGTDGGGLNTFDPGTGEIVRLNGLNGYIGLDNVPVILDLLETDHGIWLATYGNGIGLLRKENKTVSFLRHQADNPNTPGSDYIFQIFESPGGHLWFSTNWGGVFHYDPDSRTGQRFIENTADPEDSGALRSNDARLTYEDRNGFIWIGTFSGILHRLNRETAQFTYYDINAASHYRGNVIQTVFEDSVGRLWFGSRGAGIFYYDPDHDEIVPWISIDQGLPSNTVHSILQDKYGDVWVSTNHGIAKVNLYNREIKSYTLEHGLQNHEFLTGSALSDNSGYLYFGGVNGFERFHPNNIVTDATEHEVLITNLFLYNEPVSLGEKSPLQKHISLTEELMLPHHASVITLEYTAFNFSSIKGNQFSYMLEGFDENWNYVGSQRRATYTNLTPGSYLFKVRSANSDGVWSEQAATLHIMIKPPFWLSWWFGTLVVIFSGLLITGIIQYRIRRIQLRNKKLESQVKKRTLQLQKLNTTKDRLFSIIAHDLKNYASGFLGFAALMKDSSDNEQFDEIKEYSGYLYDASAEFNDFLRNLLEWARTQQNKIEYQPRIIELKPLFDRVIYQNKHNAGNKKIHILTEVDASLKVYADPDLLTIVIYNLLSNAIKFSHSGTHVYLSATTVKEDDTVTLGVRDSGVGMDQKTIDILLSSDEFITNRGTAGEKGTGLGFGICKDFVNKHNGHITINSKPNQGTTIAIILPAGTDQSHSSNP